MFKHLFKISLLGLALCVTSLSFESIAAAKTTSCPSTSKQKLCAKKLHSAKKTHVKLSAKHKSKKIKLSSEPPTRKLAQRHVSKPSSALRRASFNRPLALHEIPGQLALNSFSALVQDKESAAILYEKNPQVILPIASISKLMTAMVTLDADLPMDEILEVTDEDRDHQKNTSSRLSVGSRLSREDMLHIALMSSENRAAAALSRAYPGGRPAFIAAMNRKALSLGMTNTQFFDPTGLNSQNVSSAIDLAKMVKAAYEYPLIKRFSTDSHYIVNTGHKLLSYISTNHLIGVPGWEIKLQKTGYISEAGRCLVMAAVVQGRSVIIVLLDSNGKNTRFTDASRIRAWLPNNGTIKTDHALEEAVSENATNATNKTPTLSLDNL